MFKTLLILTFCWLVCLAREQLSAEKSFITKALHAIQEIISSVQMMQANTSTTLALDDGSLAWWTPRCQHSLNLCLSYTQLTFWE